MEFTLNKLHRSIDELRTYVTKTSVYSLTNFNYSPQEFVDPSTFEETKSRAEKMLEAESTNLTGHYALFDDLATMESALFNANVESGLSAILSKIKYVTQKRKMVTDHKTQLSAALQNPYDNTYCTRDNLEQNFATVQASLNVTKSAPQWNGVYPAKRIYLALSSLDDYDSNIKTLTKQLAELEAKRDYLNATTSVSVPLSKKAVEVLGL